MAKKSKPGDGTQGKGIRGSSERFESLFEVDKEGEPTEPRPGKDKPGDDADIIVL